MFELFQFQQLLSDYYNRKMHVCIYIYDILYSWNVFNWRCQVRVRILFYDARSKNEVLNMHDPSKKEPSNAI